MDRLNLLGALDAGGRRRRRFSKLGDPVLETPGTRIFDFTLGETVLATAITGGNPALQADKRKVVKLGANWQPFANTDLRFRADYVHSQIDRPSQASTGQPPALEAAFPQRFVRDDSGQLISVPICDHSISTVRPKTRCASA